MSTLSEEIGIEEEHIEKTLDIIGEALNRSDKTYVELSAIGASLLHCYSGMEKIIKRIFKDLKIAPPTSPSYHKELLDIASQQGIISEDLLNKLDKFRGFRHFFVHGYGILLNPLELIPLAEELPHIWKRFKIEIKNGRQHF